MKTCIYIPIHSFVDLITNSSSETYINASASSVKVVKELINTLLALGGSKAKGEDLFQVDVVYLYNDEKYNEHWLTIEEAKELFKNGTLSDETNEKDGYKGGDGYYGQSSIRVVAKVKDADVEKVAKILSKLEGLFEYESVYN